MKNAPSFIVQEFIPKATYAIYGDKAMRFVDPKIPVVMQWLRNKYAKPILINTWHSKDDGIDGRCLRIPGNPSNNPLFDLSEFGTPPDTAYKQHSDHSFGRAVDFNVVGVEVEQVQDDVVNTFYSELIPLGVTSIEWRTPTWIHLGFSDMTGYELENKNGIVLIPVPKA